jgi:hypothetical protein
MNLHLGQTATAIPNLSPGPIVPTSIVQAVAADTAFWNNVQQIIAAAAPQSTPADVANSIQVLRQGFASGVPINAPGSCPTAGESVAAFEAALIADFQHINGCGTPVATTGAGTSTFPWTLILIGAGVLVAVMLVEK